MTIYLMLFPVYLYLPSDMWSFLYRAPEPGHQSGYQRCFTVLTLVFHSLFMLLNTADPALVVEIFFLFVNYFFFSFLLSFTMNRSFFFLFILKFALIMSSFYNSFVLFFFIILFIFQLVCPTLFLMISYYLTGQPLEWDRFCKVWLIGISLAVIAQTFGCIMGTAFDTQVDNILYNNCTITFRPVFKGFSVENLAFLKIFLNCNNLVLHNQQVNCTNDEQVGLKYIYFCCVVE